MGQSVRIWDLPTRIFHWLLAALVVGSVVTANIGGNAMAWHMRIGMVILSLLLFRAVWGLVGGHWSRFSSFVASPATVWQYARGRVAEPAGHSPMGALSVLALLIALALQAGAGLFSDDEIAFSGPFTALISSQRVSQATWYHTEVGPWIVIALVLLHLVAIGYYTLVRRKTLLRPMVLGDKLLDASVPASRDDARSRLLALALWAACGGVVVAGVKWLG
ncbi:MAG: cytochrome b/b6 domain-containing protein [Burkholderiaceae bacterium]|jgi:cytochrome b|nr:cytochrome b/b6 domain-containing protein [Burkholderiaceae bacterium]MCO5105076.1 cytochrome b/b6 domain-containing protein [Burkholderiaceae bacterium]